MQNPPPLLIQMTPNGLQPYGRFSALHIGEAVNGQVYTAKERKGRTPPRNNAYWAGLHTAKNACDAWPTADRLHDDLKRLCGYVERYHNPLTGQDEIRVQSTAFNKMSESEFAAYFRHAQQRFIAIMGFDPWAQEDA